MCSAAGLKDFRTRTGKETKYDYLSLQRDDINLINIKNTIEQFKNTK